MPAKPSKARGQPEWQERFIWHNTAADSLATTALNKGAQLHDNVNEWAIAQHLLEETTTELPRAAAQRLCLAKLPKVVYDRPQRTDI